METTKEAITLNLDGLLVEDLRRMADATGLPLEDVVGRMLISWYAHNDARRSIAPEEICFEFCKTDDGGHLDPACLYRLIRSGIESRERRAYRERAILLEATGQPLDETQKALLEGERRAAQMWRHNALNEKQDVLEVAQLRADHPEIRAEIPDSYLGHWMHLVRRGKATMEQVLEACRNWKAEDEPK